LEKVIALHPGADGKPCVIGNCQAGWAVMILARAVLSCSALSLSPGSPLSYWAGVRGKNPMRYSGACSAQLAHGARQRPRPWQIRMAHGWCRISRIRILPTRCGRNRYNLYAKIDTEALRYLGFRALVGGHVNLNAEEIQTIVDDLFVGNKLAAGMIEASDGTAIDLRNISFADRGVLLEGGQHHATPASARMDS